jgi:hypothetical protein
MFFPPPWNAAVQVTSNLLELLDGIGAFSRGSAPASEIPDS